MATVASALTDKSLHERLQPFPVHGLVRMLFVDNFIPQKGCDHMKRQDLWHQKSQEGKISNMLRLILCAKQVINQVKSQGQCVQAFIT